MDSKKLRSIMVLYGDTNKSLAEFLGRSEQNICKKINENGAEFTQKEIRKIKERYNLTPELVDSIFFGH